MWVLLASLLSNKTPHLPIGGCVSTTYGGILSNQYGALVRTRGIIYCRTKKELLLWLFPIFPSSPCAIYSLTSLLPPFLLG